ncbi:hypothetical protein AK812_SmicGene34632 [Symbiodinium microadriaticum]|uniref:Uncharacterized protein n=1 Tax=Symbiodinium microadriaticum TaxID=2951 RepID=A0A1Q9CNI5_SYMMI|nr:hypothetical protein AK812_SmicGene34632 [Symbiodinium microadriaticum]
MTDKHAALSLPHGGDVVVVSAPNTSVENGALGAVPLAALETAVLQKVISHGSDSNVTCIADATCEAIALDREQMEAKYHDDVRHNLVARGMSQPVAIFHFAGHVAGSMSHKEVCLADGGMHLGGMLDDIRAFTTLIYLSACCGDDHRTGHSQHSITGCPGCGPNDNASIVCCSWPLIDVAGLGMSRDFYQHVQELSLGQGCDDVVGAAVALRAAVAEMSQRTRRDMHGLADAIQQDLSADADGRAMTEEVAARGFLALRGCSRSLLAEESDSSDVSYADDALEQLRGGYRCYSQPPVRRKESDRRTTLRGLRRHEAHASARAGARVSDHQGGPSSAGVPRRARPEFTGGSGSGERENPRASNLNGRPEPPLSGIARGIWP